MGKKVKLEGPPVKLDEETYRVDVFLDYFERLKKKAETMG